MIWWIASASAAPGVWLSASDPGFVSPIGVDDGVCDGDEPRFDGSEGQVPVFCPILGAWPPIVRTWRTDPVIAGADGSLPPDLLAIAPEFAATERAWRASAFGGPAGRLGATAPVAPPAFTGADRTAGIDPAADIDVGAIVAGEVRCAIHGVPGAWTTDAPCVAPVGAPIALELFPIVAPGAPDLPLVHVDVPLQPLLVAAESTSRVPWTAVVGAGLAVLIPIAGLAGLAIGRQTAPVPPPPPPKDPEPPVSASPPAPTTPPAPPGPPTDAYLTRQVALLAHPEVRDAAEFVAHSEWVERHRRASMALIAASDALFAQGADLPDGYRSAWNALVDDLRSREQPVARVAKSLRHLLRDPSLAAAAPMDTVVAWRAIMPHTEVVVTDGGKALADQLRVDLIRALLFPYVALGQMVTEAVPRETGLARPVLDVITHPTTFAEVLGWRYEHIELYDRTDADFMLDRDVHVTGVSRDEVWFGMRPADPPDAGVVVRVQRPRLRPTSGDARSMRAHLLVLKETA
jgi:hypothetical protein